MSDVEVARAGLSCRWKSRGKYDWCQDGRARVCSTCPIAARRNPVKVKRARQEAMFRVLSILFQRLQALAKLPQCKLADSCTSQAHCGWSTDAVRGVMPFAPSRHMAICQEAVWRYYQANKRDGSNLQEAMHLDALTLQNRPPGRY